MTIDLTPLFQAVIGILAALITYKLVPWIKSKTTEQQQATLSAAVKIAVYAAEEIYGAGHGDEKLAHAREWLRAQGYDVDVDAIKAAVNQMRDEKKLADEPIAITVPVEIQEVRE